MFAMLPDNRSLESATAISFITSSKEDENNWQTFELKDRKLIVTALTSLKNAYKDSMSLSSMNGLRWGSHETAAGAVFNSSK